MKIAQNKKINDQLNEIRKSCHQEYMLNSNMVPWKWYLLTVTKNKDDTVIHGNISNKETIESINNKDTNRFEARPWPKGTCQFTGDSILEHNDETPMSRKSKGKIWPFPVAKTKDMFYYFVPLLEKMPQTIEWVSKNLLSWEYQIAKLSSQDR